MMYRGDNRSTTLLRTARLGPQAQVLANQWIENRPPGPEPSI